MSNFKVNPAAAKAPKVPPRPQRPQLVRVNQYMKHQLLQEKHQLLQEKVILCMVM